ncbi:Small-conductance mechanosensitive channel [Micromonospora phaseoli]|uniref:Small-conductance mechanosensitive channel n=1 Tax=Micromonospora phaseoli TaxID=1144548 RepID=A0A1H7C4N0_9ACTN|nr:mechanosensitive ion channel domain-containing protein [Micromonospora phaseoli]PZV92584.1 small-conductance mechanosensitive channel [Micromonospora phaseoli]SEJ84823.1 Small-conductance mechanosensitive channel [Micromonospora phaseoli]
MTMKMVLVVAVALVVAAGLLAGVVVQRRAGGRSYRWLLAPLYRACRRPAIAVLLLAALYAGIRAYPGAGPPIVRRVVLVLLIATVTWLVLRALHVAEGAAFSRLPGETRADRRLRRARTQIRPVRRLTSVGVTVVGMGLILTTFPSLRAIGLSVLTSAGVVGALLGLSARTALGNAFAGIQVAFADGLHVGDVIVVDGQWGRVEEVKLTNVVVRLWDDRMLILPTTWFTEHPFQNWTRHGTRVVGETRLHVDHTADLDDLRTETRRIVESSPLWDRNQWVLQMVDATPQTVVVQVQASAADGPSAWDLRCDVRESLIRYLRDHHPEWLPRTRSEYHP